MEETETENELISGRERRRMRKRRRLKESERERDKLSLICIGAENISSLKKVRLVDTRSEREREKKISDNETHT